MDQNLNSQRISDKYLTNNYNTIFDLKEIIVYSPGREKIFVSNKYIEDFNETNINKIRDFLKVKGNL